MKLYKLGYSHEPVTNFIVCTVKKDSPWFYLCWSLCKPFNDKIQQPITYYATRNGILEDYPLTNAGQFLISGKFFELIKNSGANFNTYASEIIRPNREKVREYYTLNFTESFPALHWKLSEYSISPINPNRVRRVKKLVLKGASIPANKDIFRLQESKTLLLVTQKLKDQIESEKIIGVRFDPVDVNF